MVSANVDDQMRMNKALDSMGVHWTKLNDEKFYMGITDGNTPLKVTMMPGSVVCRSCGRKLVTEYYVWHQHGQNKDGASKKVNFGRHHIWFLKDNWNASVNTTLSPKQWLMHITNTSFLQH